MELAIACTTYLRPNLNSQGVHCHHYTVLAVVANFVY